MSLRELLNAPEGPVEIERVDYGDYYDLQVTDGDNSQLVFGSDPTNDLCAAAPSPHVVSSCAHLGILDTSYSM